MYLSGITSKYSKGKLSKLSIARVKYIFYRTFNYIYVNAILKKTIVNFSPHWSTFQSVSYFVLLQKGWQQIYFSPICLIYLHFHEFRNNVFLQSLDKAIWYLKIASLRVGLFCIGFCGIVCRFLLFDCTWF